MLKINGITVNYGVIKALHKVTLEIRPGEILSVIGANGAGKTTLLKTIAGLLKPQGGNIEFEGREISGLKPEKIVKCGITMVPEGRRVFPDLSVKENLELGGYSLHDRHLKKELYGLILTTFPRLGERLKQPAGTLSGGEQQMLAMGRALMANPKLLLLDEPSMGLSPIITKEIFALIQFINKEKHISMILVEQNAHIAMEHSQRTNVLENGSIVMEGESSALKHDARVTEAYLGI
ncbi:MAG: ABC transporter ATP-binding protein [Proteobacteria bacterium]|nr:ABC transporter ATP-binding protein [Pseudomonadota bacterium]